jgi:thymidylate kinase
MPDWSKLRGRFIVLDGGEGCGKSTQARAYPFAHAKRACLPGFLK